MPAATAVALDSFLEHRSTRLCDSRHPHNHHYRANRTEGSSGRGGSSNGNSSSLAVDVRRPSPSFVQYFSPILYTTPEPTQLAGASPTSVSPSPYVLNHKRRDFRLPAPAAEVASGSVEVGFVPVVQEEEEREESEKVVKEEEEDERTDGGLNLDDDVLGVEKGKGGCDDLYVDPGESSSMMNPGYTEEERNGYHDQVIEKSTHFLSNSEFFDATDDFSLDSPASLASPVRSNIEADLSSVRVKLLEEIERRNKVEESLTFMQNQWKKMGAHFHNLGLSFPLVPDGLNMQHEADFAQVCQEIVVSRFVCGAIERGLARAEIEASAAAIIETKNHEISRLHERLQYCETVTREMSQRNQEVIETARQKRQQRRRKRQRWLWGSIGLSFTIGASLLAYSFIPQASKAEQPSFESEDFSESSSSSR